MALGRFRRWRRRASDSGAIDAASNFSSEEVAVAIETAVDLIEVGGWVQEQEALDSQLNAVDAAGHAASRFSAVGALRRSAALAGPPKGAAWAAAGEASAAQAKLFDLSADALARTLETAGETDASGSKDPADLQDWNDQPGQSKEQVLRMLLEAARDLRAAEESEG